MLGSWRAGEEKAAQIPSWLLVCQSRSTGTGYACVHIGSHAVGDADLVLLPDHPLKHSPPEPIAPMRISDDLRLPFNVGLPGTPDVPAENRLMARLLKVFLFYIFWTLRREIFMSRAISFVPSPSVFDEWSSEPSSSSTSYPVVQDQCQTRCEIISDSTMHFLHSNRYPIRPSLDGWCSGLQAQLW